MAGVIPEASNNFSHIQWGSFQQKFHERELIPWLYENRHLSVFFCALLLVFLLILQKYMETRPPVNVRVIIIPWGFLLAIWNFLGTSIFFQERMYVLQRYELKHSVCNMEYYTGAVGFWSLVYVCVKMAECAECVFIVLQKKDRLCRQLFHHTTLLVYCWYAYSGNQVLCRWFALVNYADHGIWYIYFPLRAARVKMAKWITLFAIFTSIIETGSDIGLTLYTLVLKWRGEDCIMTYTSLPLSLGLIFVYLMLHIVDFHESAKRKKKRKMEQKTD